MRTALAVALMGIFAAGLSYTRSHENSSSTFITAGMHNNVIRLAADLKIVYRPVRTNLCRIVDHEFVIRIFPVVLIRDFGVSINHAPLGWRLNVELNGIRFVADDVHENLSTCITRVTDIKLRVRSG